MFFAIARFNANFQGESEIRFDLPLPVIATNIMIEFTDFFENVSASIETLQCPRCSASVQVRNYFCSTFKPRVSEIMLTVSFFFNFFLR